MSNADYVFEVTVAWTGPDLNGGTKFTVKGAFRLARRLRREMPKRLRPGWIKLCSLYFEAAYLSPHGDLVTWPTAMLLGADRARALGGAALTVSLRVIEPDT